MSLKVAMIGPFPERIGVITGGVEGVVHCLTVGLRRVADLELHILAPAYHRPAGTEERDGMTIHWLKVPFPPFLTNWSVFRRRVHLHLADIRPDIAHFQGVASWPLNYRDPCVLDLPPPETWPTTHGDFLFPKDFSQRMFRYMNVLVPLFQRE